ncbi:hypothetical protein SAMN04487950_2441 [Halogranum rubrum]|uniref:Uncharacterized protein n=1 Tax=Halogranum rubrum TaxID=553466 RepID=A0A1I4EW45_9EURY|nr:hypothetical protein [Halogranum rubrum]SFL09938.1 hypothetical protein SAMN04487950_2441 [Halogranum rubrum]
MSLAVEVARTLLIGLVIGPTMYVVHNGVDSLSRRAVAVVAGLFVSLCAFLFVVSPHELRGVGLQLVAVVVLGVSFWVYYDALDRLSNLEAAVWALGVLCLGLVSFLGVGYALLAVLTVVGYVARTRVVASTAQ